MNKQKTFVETPSHTDTSIITAADAALRYIAATHGAEVPLEPFSAAVTAQALASALHPYKTPHGREADSKMVMAISTTQQQAEPVALIMCDGKSYDFMVTVEGQKRIPDTGEFVHLYAAQPAAVAVPNGWRDAMELAAEDLEDNNCLESAHQLRAMLAAAPQAADPIKRLIAMHNELLGEYPYCYFELAYTRRTDWMAWLCTKPREDDPERKVLACGQGLTAEEACAEAISAAQKGGA